MVSENEDIGAEEKVRASNSMSGKWPLLPFVITLAALLVYFAFNTLQLTVERGNLAAIKSSQEAAIQEAQKIQAQFKMLVGKIGDLAAQGHVGAKMVMEGLQSQGLGSAPETTPPVRPDPKPVK